MTGSLNWLGHDDLCSIQWSDYCDCGPTIEDKVPLERPFEQTLSDADGDLG